MKIYQKQRASVNATDLSAILTLLSTWPVLVVYVKMADFGQDTVIAISSTDEFNSVLHTLALFCTALIYFSFLTIISIEFCSIIM